MGMDTGLTTEEPGSSAAVESATTSAAKVGRIRLPIMAVPFHVDIKIPHGIKPAFSSGNVMNRVLPLVLDEEVQLMDDLFGLGVRATGRQLGMEDLLVEGALLRVGTAFEGGPLAQLPLHVPARVA